MRKIIKILYSSVWWLLAIADACVLIVIAFLVFIIAYPFDPKRKAEHVFSIFWALHYFYFNPLWRLKYVCNASIDSNQPYVIVCNHQSMLDICAMYKLPLVFKWVSKEEVFRMPFVGWMLKMHGDILIKRGERQSAKDMLKQASSWIDKKCSISIFPEGTRSSDGCIHEFKEGAFLIAKLYKTPIIPVVVEGTGRMFPSRSFFIGGCTRARIHVLPVIDAETVASMKIRDLSNMLHDMMLAEHRKMAPEKYGNDL
jgi:1-acyl-sn-glycerol-3-phosphate acyltransferase